MRIVEQGADFVMLEDYAPDLVVLRNRVAYLNRRGLIQLDNKRALGCLYTHGDPLFSQFMFQSFLRLQELGLLKDAVPTYTFLRQYLPGSSLPFHRDREECEWTLSLAIEGEGEIFFQFPSGEKGFCLKPNQAILYRGTDTSHWRNEVLNYHSVCLQHFKASV